MTDEHTVDIAAIRARLDALDVLFNPTVRPRLSGDIYYAILDKWDKVILSIGAGYIGPEAVENAVKAIFNVPIDIDALLKDNDALRARVAELEEILDTLDKPLKYQPLSSRNVKMRLTFVGDGKPVLGDDSEATE